MESVAIRRRERVHAVEVVALGLGLGRAEVLGLRWEPVGLENRIMTNETEPGPPDTPSMAQ